jgi:membrane protein YqaA with SNARE-associated domain
LQVGALELATLYELLCVLATSFILNLIPFAGPSNLLIASNAALLVDADPFTIGFIVAFGSASAKFVHYIVTFFVSGFVSEKSRKHLDETAVKIRRWAMFALFVVAATPLPDEPVIIPLGLLKYNPAKFYIAYFLGKLAITIIGAHLGKFGQNFMAPWMGPEILIAVSIILTIVITFVLLKVDVKKTVERILKRKAVQTILPFVILTLRLL